jgi:hypothetical protein
MMGRRFRIPLITLGWLALTAAGAAYFDEIPDLPIMPLLAAAPGAGVVFDTPAGRIVSVFAKGKVAPASVLDYYGGALPQLGWLPDGKARFRRESERLRIEFIDNTDGLAEGLTVRFVLSPL